MKWSLIFDKTALLIAFIAVLVVYTTLELHGSDSAATALRDLLLALAGALAGISLPRGSSQ